MENSDGMITGKDLIDRKIVFAIEKLISYVNASTIIYSAKGRLK
jgi:hypothetical protein